MNSEKLKIYWLYVTVFVTGAAVLVLEILGTRIIGPFYGNTIFVWTSSITVTLSALALGYLVGGKIIDRYPYPQILYGVVALVAPLVFLIMKIDQWVLPFTDGFGIEWGSLIATGLLFALPLFLLGMAGPIAIRLISRDVAHLGSVAGKVFSVATLGSIAGALLAGFFLLPLLSITAIFQALGLILLGVAMAGFFFDRLSLRMSFAVVIAAVAALGFEFLVSKYEHQDYYTFQLYHQEQSLYGDLKVMSVGGSYCLTLNGFTQSCIDPEGEPSFGNVYEMAGVVNSQFLAAPQGESFRALVLGVAGGDILRKIFPTVEVDAVEIDPQILGLAKDYFNFNPPSSQHIFLEDGRRFLRKTQEKYDVIVFDAYAGGIIPAHFLSVEAFRLFADTLKPKGILVMNIAGRPSGDDRLLMSIMRAAERIFPSVILIATNPENKDLLQGMVFYAARSPNYTPPDSEWYKLVEFNASDRNNGMIFTDDYAPADFFAAETFALFRKNMKIFGGYKPFFSL